MPSMVALLYLSRFPNSFLAQTGLPLPVRFPLPLSANGPHPVMEPPICDQCLIFLNLWSVNPAREWQMTERGRGGDGEVPASALA